MTLVQRLFKAILPRKWGDAMETESRTWMIQCQCGYERSVWDAGCIRFKAKGHPTRYVRCPRCGFAWHTLYKRMEAPVGEQGA